MVCCHFTPVPKSVVLLLSTYQLPVIILSPFLTNFRISRIQSLMKQSNQEKKLDRLGLNHALDDMRERKSIIELNVFL